MPKGQPKPPPGAARRDHYGPELALLRGVGQRIREARQAMGMKQSELAKEVAARLGSDSGNSCTLSKYENGDFRERGIPYRYLIAVADATEVSTDWLLGINDPECPNNSPAVLNTRIISHGMRAYWKATEERHLASFRWLAERVAIFRRTFGEMSRAAGTLQRAYEAAQAQGSVTGELSRAIAELERIMATASQTLAVFDAQMDAAKLLEQANADGPRTAEGVEALRAVVQEWAQKPRAVYEMNRAGLARSMGIRPTFLDELVSKERLRQVGIRTEQAELWGKAYG